jgi:hypothetical protein
VRALLGAPLPCTSSSALHIAARCAAHVLFVALLLDTVSCKCWQHAAASECCLCARVNGMLLPMSAHAWSACW